MLNGIFDIVSSFQIKPSERHQGKRHARGKSQRPSENQQQLADEQRDMWLKSLAFFIFK